MVKGYSRIQIALHWAVALLILYQLLFGDAMSEVWRSLERSGTYVASLGSWAHIIVGSLVLLGAVWRLGLRLRRGVPPPPPGESRAMALLGHAGHGLLYALMIAMPVTGLLAWYGGVEGLADLHGELLKSLLWLMIGLHVVAALYHQIIRKDNLIARMVRASD